MRSCVTHSICDCNLQKMEELQRIKSCAQLLIAHWDEYGLMPSLEEHIYWLDRIIKMEERDEQK